MTARAPTPPQGGGFTAALVERLTELERTSWWYRERARLITWAVGRYTPHADSLLDIGCGTGVNLEAVAAAFPKMSLSGCDMSEAALGVAARRVPGARLERGDARDLAWPERFSVVGAFDVLEHVDDDGKVLEAMVRAATKGGAILLTVPQHPWLWSSFDEFSGHLRRYDPRSLRALCAEARIEVVFMTSFVFFALPAMAVARLGDRGGRRDPLKALDPGPLASGVLRGSVRAERALIRAGVALPAGGSLLVVGRT